MTRWRWIILAILVWDAPLAAQQLPDIGRLMARSRDRHNIEPHCPLGFDFEDEQFECVDLPDTGGGGTSEGGVTLWVATVVTQPGQAYVDTAETIPAGAIVDICIPETLDDIEGGYELGVAGISDLYARMPGVAGEARDPRWFSPAVGTHVDSPRRVTSAGGAFANAGRVKISCWYRLYAVGGE